LGLDRVVIVAPIVATTPLWNLIIAAVFLRGREELNARTIARDGMCHYSRHRAIALGR
jgi:hypothetical protein